MGKRQNQDNEDTDYLRPGDVSASYLAGFILKRGCLTLLVILLGLIGGCIFLEPYQHRAIHARLYCTACTATLGHIGRVLYNMARPDEDPEFWQGVMEPLPEITPDMTVADLIREALQRKFIPEEELCCPYSKRPYLVFPVPASVLLQPDDPHNRIPIVMDCPDSHMETDFRVKFFMPRDSYTGKKYHLTARVLYADGGVGTISMEEAEKLVSKYSPVPMEIVFETKPEEEQTP